MCESRGLEAKTLVHQNLSIGIGNVPFSPDDMGDFHGGVVNNTGKVVLRRTVRPEQDEVPDVLGVHLQRPKHLILELDN